MNNAANRQPARRVKQVSSAQAHNEENVAPTRKKLLQEKQEKQEKRAPLRQLNAIAKRPSKTQQQQQQKPLLKTQLLKPQLQKPQLQKPQPKPQQRKQKDQQQQPASPPPPPPPPPPASPCRHRSHRIEEAGEEQQQKKQQQQQQREVPRLLRQAHLPESVDDVDSGTDHPCMESAYVKDIFVYLSERELYYRVDADFMSKQAQITPKMRAILVDWLQQLCQKLQLVADTMYLCVRLLDRFLQQDRTVPKSQLQLLGATSLWLASKVEEIYCVDIKDLVYYCNNTFTKRDFKLMEMRMMRALQFDLMPPLPITFLRRLSKVGSVSNKLHHVAKYLLELSTLHSEFSCKRPSQLAAAALIMALKCDSAEWTPGLQFYSGYTMPELLITAAELGKVAEKAPTLKQNSAYKRYSSSTNLSVATCPAFQPNSDWLANLYEAADVIGVSS